MISPSNHFCGVKDSFLLSAQECITAGSLQNKYRNLTKYCTEGYFGSKFVTLVASGNGTSLLLFLAIKITSVSIVVLEYYDLVFFRRPI